MMRKSKFRGAIMAIIASISFFEMISANLFLNRGMQISIEPIM